MTLALACGTAAAIFLAALSISLNVIGMRAIRGGARRTAWHRRPRKYKAIRMDWDRFLGGKASGNAAE